MYFLFLSPNSQLLCPSFYFLSIIPINILFFLQQSIHNKIHVSQYHLNNSQSLTQQAKQIKRLHKHMNQNSKIQTKFIFNIDRGGTFTDFYVQEIQKKVHNTNNNNTEGQCDSNIKPQSQSNQSNMAFTQSQQLYNITNQFVFKFPSQSNLGEGPIVGIRNFLIQKALMKKQDPLIPLKHIFQINLGTTIATNALLQRKGDKNCMILTKGFKDLLTMRYLARPNIFDLQCKRANPLFTQIIEADERIFVKQPNPQLKAQLILNSQNQTIKLYRKSLSQQQIKRICKQIKQKQYKSVGISFCHSVMDKHTQQALKQALVKQNFQFIQLGSQFAEVGYLKRSQTTNLNAFLGPLIKNYFSDLINNFVSEENQSKPSQIIRIMKSNGGFSQYQNVKPSQILLSGPAGGLIGYNKMIQTMQKISELKINNLIGLDMGGTSTDISRVQNGQFNIKPIIQIQSVFVCQPHLQIQTIAAGGGSILYYENGLFKVGPESVGSNPGPACYGIGDNALALTDANFLLNRIDSKYFPKIFGKNRNQGLNLQASKRAFQKISIQINKDQQKYGLSKKSVEQVAEGFIKIANELMAKSARKFFTFGNPDAFVVFGSAGGQHCCELAQKLDIHHLFIHRYSGVLSAYGLSKAPETQQKKIYLGKKATQLTFNYQQFLKQLNSYIQQPPKLQNYNQKKIFIMIGYMGTNYELLIDLSQNMFTDFQSMHKKQNGFSLPLKQYRIQYLIVKYFKYPPTFRKQATSQQVQNINNFLIKQDDVFLDGKWRKIPFYDITQMVKSKFEGQAMIISKTVTVLVKQNWQAIIQNDCIYLKRMQKKSTQHVQSKKLYQMDPIILSLYSTRLMSIAQQMGKVLQRISISTNIKQRLDFSCGIFDWSGKMLANAPHIPVHLGSMGTAVKQQMIRGIKPGQSVLTNHPIAGGSHLPDLTVVTCVQIQQNLNIFVAPRGHHADIGGIVPGSMPPFSKYLEQQGLAVQKFHLIDQQGNFRQKQTRQLFKHSRKINDNISDLLAQVAANKLGIKLLKKFVNQQGLQKFKTYIGYIYKNASDCVQQLLVDFSLKNNFKQIDSIQNSQFMDDGSQIKLKLTINRVQKKAIFDFTGTSIQILGNTNAPFSITQSAILYSLRSLIGKDIPLNAGSLEPIQTIVPHGTLLSPSKNSAVVGGNVETSQRIVDLILKPFKVVAASQGTMNNFLFGNDNISYYETIGGGSGAGDGFNGKTCQVHMTNTRITDIQNLQNKYPIILNQFSIREGSGGSGKYNGGDGVIRQFIYLEPLKVSILSERRVFSPYGLMGGKNGQKGRNIYKRYDQEYKVIRSLGSKNMLNVQKYDIVRIQTPGGGGYGQQKE